MPIRLIKKGGDSLTNTEIIKASWHPGNTDWKVRRAWFGDHEVHANAEALSQAELPMIYRLSGNGSVAKSSTAYVRGADTITNSTSGAGQLAGVEMSGETAMRFGDGRIIIGARVKLGSNPTGSREQLYIGVGDNYGTFAAERAAWFIDKNQSTSNWINHTGDTSYRYNDSGESINTNWVNLEIDIAADLSSVKFYKDGSLVFTESDSSYIPSSGTGCNVNCGWRSIDATNAYAFDIASLWVAEKWTNAEGSWSFDLS